MNFGTLGPTPGLADPCHHPSARVRRMPTFGWSGPRSMRAHIRLSASTGFSCGYPRIDRRSSRRPILRRC